MKLRFYKCTVCGKIIAILSPTEAPTICCGRTMQELIPNQTDGASEKHVPVFSVTGDTVKVNVGSLPHPMTEAHHITWIGLSTSGGFMLAELDPVGSPETVFTVSPGDTPEVVYAYCNLHGLWSAEVQ